MKRKFFWRNFIRLMASVIIPLILLGPATIFITYKYAVGQSNQNSLDILYLAGENLELMLSHADFLTESLDSNLIKASFIKTILRSSELTYEMKKELDFITGLIAVPTHSKTFIHSVYIYVDNPYRRYLSSNTNILSIDIGFDRTWYESYKAAKPDVHQWIEVRKIKSYANDPNTQPVITLYRRLNSTSGVIVLNIRQTYFNNMIAQLKKFDGKSLVVVGPEKEHLFSSMPGFDPLTSGIQFEDYPDGEPISVQINGKNHLMTKLKSNRFNWTYVSFIPADTLYSVPKRIMTLILCALIVTVIIGLILSYSLTRKNHRRIINIIDVFQAAENEKRLPPILEDSADEYSYILQNIIKTFVEQDYLKMQLSLKQLSLKNSELLALQSQLNPHFMANTLETINLEFLTFTKKPTNANRMITQLADMLRYALEEKPGGTVAISKELENTRRYIEIQTYRYEDKFFMRWNIDDAALHFQVPLLIFQPLIENCIYHGIKEKKGLCGVKLSINMQTDGLSIRITDNGIGITPEALADIRHKLAHPEIDNHGHIGLYNVNKRLALTFGERYRITIFSKFMKGTSIHLFLPDIIHTP